MGLDWVQSVTVVSVLGSITETLGVVQLIHVAGTLNYLCWLYLALYSQQWLWAAVLPG